MYDCCTIHEIKAYRNLQTKNSDYFGFAFNNIKIPNGGEEAYYEIFINDYESEYLLDGFHNYNSECIEYSKDMTRALRRKRKYSRNKTVEYNKLKTTKRNKDNKKYSHLKGMQMCDNKLSEYNIQKCNTNEYSNQRGILEEDSYQDYLIWIHDCKVEGLFNNYCTENNLQYTIEDYWHNSEDYKDFDEYIELKGELKNEQF